MRNMTEAYVREDLRRRLARHARGAIALGGLSRAAVLVPIVFRTGEPELLFTRRTETVETHKGQISFPGGVVHPDDVDEVATALRETEEEIGLPASQVETVGLLDDLHTPTGFLITPVVGLITQLPALHPSPDEVAEVFFVPVDFFTRPGTSRREDRWVQGERREVWLYDYDGRTIWGATAAIIRSLVAHTREDFVAGGDSQE